MAIPAQPKQDRRVGTVHYERVTKTGPGHWSHEPFTDQVAELVAAASELSGSYGSRSRLLAALEPFR
jgi:hypothetical protein